MNGFYANIGVFHKKKHTSADLLLTFGCNNTCIRFEVFQTAKTLPGNVCWHERDLFPGSICSFLPQLSTFSPHEFVLFPMAFPGPGDFIPVDTHNNRLMPRTSPLANHSHPRSAPSAGLRRSPQRSSVSPTRRSPSLEVSSWRTAPSLRVPRLPPRSRCTSAVGYRFVSCWLHGLRSNISIMKERWADGLCLSRHRAYLCGIRG